MSIPLFKSRVVARWTCPRAGLGRQPRRRGHRRHQPDAALRARQGHRHDQRAALEPRQHADRRRSTSRLRTISTASRRSSTSCCRSSRSRCYSAQRSIVLSGRVSNASRDECRGAHRRGLPGPDPDREESPAVRAGHSAPAARTSPSARSSISSRSAARSRSCSRSRSPRSRAPSSSACSAQFNAICQGRQLERRRRQWRRARSRTRALSRPATCGCRCFDRQLPRGARPSTSLRRTTCRSRTRACSRSFLNDNFLFNLAIDAAKEKGLAKILAEPTLTTLTGQEAQFLSGGEFPIPVADGVNGVTIEFKEFGVGLKFLPVVLVRRPHQPQDQRQRQRARRHGSLLLRADSVRGHFRPCPARAQRERARSSSATARSMGLAGLINENLREVVTKFPGLGDLPILGALFRSQQFQKGQTELVILVTPRLAKPLAPGSVTLPTDKFVEPTDAEFYWGGQDRGHADGRRPPDEINGRHHHEHQDHRFTVCRRRPSRPAAVPGPGRRRRSRLRQFQASLDQGAGRRSGKLRESEHRRRSRASIQTMLATSSRPCAKASRKPEDVESRSRSAWAARQGGN